MPKVHTAINDTRLKELKTQMREINERIHIIGKNMREAEKEYKANKFALDLISNYTKKYKYNYSEGALDNDYNIIKAHVEEWKALWLQASDEFDKLVQECKLLRESEKQIRNEYKKGL